MWFAAMLLAGNCVLADDIISKAWKDMREQPWHRPELQFPKPPDPLSTVVEKATRAQRAIVAPAVERHQTQEKMCQLFGESFITLQSSWNEEVDIVHSDIKKLNNLFETKPNCREKKQIKKTNNMKKKEKNQNNSNKSGSQFETSLMSCVGPLNTNTLSNGELHKLRILMSNLQTPSCDEQPK